jgi:tRNA modification GTPase
MHKNEDTIVAVATPRGRGGVGIVRVSGPNTMGIAEQILGKIPKTRQAEYLPFLAKNGDLLDEGIALFFKGPHSFTGEDILELQGHGGPVIMDGLVEAVVKAGARLAEPGEFSLRAFLNNKIDLTQAEAIADLINASSKEAAKGALRTMQGAFSKSVEEIVQNLITLRMLIEASIDFPEEEIDFLSDKHIEATLQDLIGQIDGIATKAHQGSLMSEGVKVVIMGRPNAGKSSLLNVLSGYDAAIVSESPGTTRDVLRENFSLDGLLIQLVDTAGLRVEADLIEKEGIKRALKEITVADHVIVVVDGTVTRETDPKQLFPEWIEKIPQGIGVTVLYNKIDCLDLPPFIEKKEHYIVVGVSAKTGAGLLAFRNHLKDTVGFSESSEGNFIARRRHIEALAQTKQHVQAGALQWQQFKAGELLAEELRQAQLALDQITGKFTSDDLLGKIFSEFCIGK